MAYWIAYLSNIAHIGAICGYVRMFGLWRLPNQDGADVFYYKNIVICRLGRALHAMVPIGWYHVSLLAYCICKDMWISLPN